jgi:hypothetical protein
LFIPDPDADFLPIPDPGSRGQKGTRSRIPHPDPQHWTKVGYRTLFTLFIAGGGRKSATYKYGYIPEHDSTFVTLTRVPKGWNPFPLIKAPHPPPLSFFFLFFIIKIENVFSLFENMRSLKIINIYHILVAETLVRIPSHLYMELYELEKIRLQNWNAPTASGTDFPGFLYEVFTRIFS